MSRLSSFIERAYYWCQGVSLGYDQSNRWDFRDGGACDCSSLAYECLWYAGYLARPEGNPYDYTLYTGTIRGDLVNAGWSVLPADIGIAQPGDVLLNDGMHVAMVVDGYGYDAWVAQASIDENGNIMGGMGGDQTGGETNISPIYNYGYGWSCILRPPAEDYDPVPPTPQNPDDPLDVDGWIGYLSIRKWQHQMGTPADGEIWGQYEPNYEFFWAFTCKFTWDASGSTFVRALQSFLTSKGYTVDIDGILGHDTIMAVQRFLIDRGYSVGESGADGRCGNDTAKAIQQSLNDGAWK